MEKLDAQGIPIDGGGAGQGRVTIPAMHGIDMAELQRQIAERRADDEAHGELIKRGKEFPGLLEQLGALHERLAETEKAYAALSRAAWHALGEMGSHPACFFLQHPGMTHLYYELIVSPLACQCDPPGSREEWCTGHCLHRPT